MGRRPRPSWSNGSLPGLGCQLAALSGSGLPRRVMGVSTGLETSLSAMQKTGLAGLVDLSAMSGS